MARSFVSPLALALCAAACGSDAGNVDHPPDAASALCATSAECGVGNWCNPKGTICEPRGTTYQFAEDIYPELRDACAGCHVAGVADTHGTGTIAVFAGGPDVAYASLVEGGTSCDVMPHRLCVSEPKSPQAVARLITHLNANQTPLLPGGYADPWLQKLLRWTAAGAHRTAIIPDAPPFRDAPGDAPSGSTPDAKPLPDAPAPPPDAPPPPPDARPIPDALVPPPGKPVITSPTANASTGATQIPVIWTAAPPSGSAITQYQVVARRVSDGAPSSVTCAAPFSTPPCHINADQSIGATVGGLDNCAAYDLTVAATSATGTTISDALSNVTPRELPSVPTLSALAKVDGSVGELLLSWNASNANGCGPVSYTVELTPPAGFTCGNPAGGSCLNDAGTSTSYDMTTNVPVCDYPNVSCDSPRTWAFRVRATSSGGTSGFSDSASGTPRMGYAREAIWGIFAAKSCLGCHRVGANVLVLDDGGDASHGTSWTNVRNTANVVAPFAPDSSLLHLCPTQSGGCNTASGFTTHPGGQRYLSGSLEDTAIVHWIVDGALF